MTELLATVLRWITRKFAVFLLILVVLVAGAWLRNQWSLLERKLGEIRQKEDIAANLREELARIDHSIKEQGAAFEAKLAELSNLDGIARKAWAEEAKARAKMEYWDREVGVYAWLFEKWKVEEKARAHGEHWIKRQAAETAQAAKAAFESTLGDSPVRALLDDKARKQKAIADIESLVAAERVEIGKDPRQRALAAVRSQLPAALWILLGVVLVPVFVKALLYHLLAPLAARLPPIRILPEGGPPPPLPVIRASAVSHPVELPQGEELLVHPDYLQSSAATASRRTQWFLNARIPLSSLASGMVMLTRVRPKDSACTKVVVSAQKDPFGELGILELPAGAAMVIQPRSLAGVVKREGHPVHISRHWRLGCLHSWLTLQLRFLVFHGPCKLILKGCRGILAEQPDPGHPRQINQDATIGFSANLEYRNVRCETFLSYLRGKEALFNDLFGGGPGVFAYEEMPAAPGKGVLVGRGLEGLADAVLKVFGI